MSKNIHPRDLRSNLWRRGPYIVYFSGKDKDIDHNVVQNMKEISKRYKTIKVLELDWDEYVEYEAKVYSDGMKYVLAYFKGKLEISEMYPDIYKIEQIFHKCQFFLNIASEEKIFHKIEFRKNSNAQTKIKCKKDKKPLSTLQKIHKNYRNISNKRRKNMKNYQLHISTYNKFNYHKTYTSNINNDNLTEKNLRDNTNITKAVVPTEVKPNNVKYMILTKDPNKNDKHLNYKYNTNISFPNQPNKKYYNTIELQNTNNESSIYAGNKKSFDYEILNPIFSSSYKNPIQSYRILSDIPNSFCKLNPLKTDDTLQSSMDKRSYAQLNYSKSNNFPNNNHFFNNIESNIYKTSFVGCINKLSKNDYL